MPVSHPNTFDTKCTRPERCTYSHPSPHARGYPVPYAQHLDPHAQDTAALQPSHLINNNNAQEHASHSNPTPTPTSTLSPLPLHRVLLLLPRPLVHNVRDAGPAQALERVDQLVRLVELLHVVAAADALALHQDVGHCAPARHLRERVLQLGAQRVLVELDDVWRGRDCVFFEQDLFCALGEGAVGLGEDYYCGWVLASAGVWGAAGRTRALL